MDDGAKWIFETDVKKVRFQKSEKVDFRVTDLPDALANIDQMIRECGGM